METRCIFKFLLLLIGIYVAYPSMAQIPIFKIEQVDSLIIQHPKPILLLITTDWCQFCAMQKKQIRRNENFRKHSNQFYYIEFDAEQKNPVSFNKKLYHYQPRGLNIGIHELALIFNDHSEISYPMWLLLDQNYKPIFRQNGLLHFKQMNELLAAIKETFSEND